MGKAKELKTKREIRDAISLMKSTDYLVGPNFVAFKSKEGYDLFFKEGSEGESIFVDAKTIYVLHESVFEEF